MRLLCNWENETQSILFKNILEAKGIQCQLEVTPNPEWGETDFSPKNCRIWVIDEEDFPKAEDWLALFEENPNHPELFYLPSEIEKEKPQTGIRLESSKSPPLPQTFRPPVTGLTLGLLVLCTLIFLGQLFTSPEPIRAPTSSFPVAPLQFSEVDKALLYDYPTAYQQIDQLIESYGLSKIVNSSELPEKTQLLLKSLVQTPQWQGIYPIIVDKIKGAPPKSDQMPILFQKIREGEIWRLATPALLHYDIIHLLFNMLWLGMLGKQMEERMGKKKLLFFILIIAIVSNTAQYLMSGPFFLGFSGIVCGMIAFIWVRQKNAAWEGYSLQRSTFNFIAAFVILMFLLSLGTFIYEVAKGEAISAGLANTAHLAGALAGYLLAKTDRFAALPPS